MLKSITKENLEAAVETYLKNQFGDKSTDYTKEELTLQENRGAFSRLFHASGAEGYLRAHKVLKLLEKITEISIDENIEKCLLLLTLAIMNNKTGKTLKNTIAESLGYKETVIVAGSGIGSVGASFSPSANLAPVINNKLILQISDQTVIDDIYKEIQMFLNDKTVQPENDNAFTKLLDSINTQIENADKQEKGDTLMTSLGSSNSGTGSS